MLTKLLGMRFIEVEASSLCNVRCRFCSRDQLPAAGLMRIETFADFLVSAGLRSSDLVGFIGLGEPLLNPQLPQMVHLAKVQSPGSFVWVTTNGQALNQRRCEALLDAGLDQIDVSVNGVDAESYEALVPGARFERVLANVRRAAALAHARGGRCRVQVNFIVTRENQAQVGAIEAFWRAQGVDAVRPQRLHRRGGTVEVEGMSMAEKAEAGGCELLDVYRYVSWQGEVHPCYHDVRRAHAVGRVGEASLEELHAKLLRAKPLLMLCQMCRACDDPARQDLRAYLDRLVAASLKERVRRLLPSRRVA